MGGANLGFGELLSVSIIGITQTAGVIICICFLAEVFDTFTECPYAKFEDDGLFLAQITALILTTPWNLEKKLDTLFVFVISATLFFTFALSIIISENSIEELRNCQNRSGKKGGYYSLVWINLFSFLHTAVLWGYRIYRL